MVNTAGISVQCSTDRNILILLSYRCASYKIKLFQAFETEVANRQQRIDEVLGAGQELIDSGHFAADKIEEWCDELTESWEKLLEKCTERRDILGDAAESQRVRQD